jgi:Ca2+-binding RTX toxin-like protein
MSTFGTNLQPSGLDGTDGFQISGEVSFDGAGRSVSSAGDVNGDGFGDIIIGASGTNSNGNSDSGAAYVVFGKSGGFAANLNLSTLDGTTNVDTITDFSAVDDTIVLDDAVFTSLGMGVLSADAFILSTTGNAADASDRIIYESNTGRLFFDKDGTGAAAKVHFATIGTNLVLTNADFLVI